MKSMKKKSLKENLSLTLEARPFVSYADYAYRVPPFRRVVLASSSPEPIDVTVRFLDENGLFISNGREVTVPYESEVEVSSEGLLNPAYLAKLTSLSECVVTVTVEKKGEVILSAKQSLTVLPFDTYGGLSSEAEFLCGFVRPGTNEGRAILSDAKAQLKQWGLSEELNGYERDKNTALKQFAAIYSAFKKRNYQRVEADFSSPVSLQNEGIKRSELDLALLFSACLESAGLFPVLLLGKEIAVGAWLYEGCFYSAVLDDLSVIENYISDGIHNLAFVRAFDLFGEEGSFSRAGERLRDALKKGAYEYCLDVRRGRLGGYRPLPVRNRAEEGYELLDAKALSPETAPEEIADFKLSLDKKLPKNKQWERRLLDLSFKNPLLNFSPKKNAVPVAVSSLDEFYVACAEKGSLRLYPSGEEGRRILREKSLAKSLIEAELAEGNLRSECSEEELSEVVPRIIRKGKEADEESGGNLIYLALGFLHYTSQNRAFSAPLLLLPVRIKKTKGSDYFTLEIKDEPGMNTTLLEYLKQEYDIDIRGLDQSIEALRIREILAMVRSEISRMKGWTVEESVYLSVFSFTRYFLWNDVRKHIELFKETPIVRALFSGSALETEKFETKEREAYKPYEVLTPLPMDSSQFEAVALSKAGASFVLHGPPGTGKSQTITNMIANALHDRKRVLFVAEKGAALSVVKRRLESIGVGEFCLELHSSRAEKGDVVKKIEDVLSLQGKEVDFQAEGDRLNKTENDIKRVYDSVHKIRRIGVSVYEGIVKYLSNKDAPDLLGIDSAFYDSLTKEKIDRFEELLLSASFAAEECGGVGSSPFENVNLTEYSTEIRDGVYCASKCILSEISHLKGYLSLFTAQYRQTVSVITTCKLQKLKEIASRLLSGRYDGFYRENEETFREFFHANKRLDELSPSYFARFKRLVEIEDLPSFKAELSQGEDCLSQKTARTVLRKLEWVARGRLLKEERLSALRLAAELNEASKRLRDNPLAQPFLKRDGSIDFGARENYLSDLKDLHALCEDCFLDYNADTFNSMCHRTVGGSTKSVLFGLIHAVDGFADALKTFSQTIALDEKGIRSDDLFRYFSDKANALLSGIDKLGSWCKYKKTAYTLKEAGLGFMVDGMESGKVDPSNIVSCFEKHVYRNFLDTFFTGDSVLSAFSRASLEEKAEELKALSDTCMKKGRAFLRAELIARVPDQEEEGPVSLELMNFKRFAGSRGGSVKKIFTEFPLLLKRTVPCMLMSPTTVAAFLPPEREFDLVIFDEASQLPTAEAIGSLARAKSAIVVGDPNQLPPTSFFSSGYVDEDNLENEDLESVLDDALAIGMPERYLTWHYRSRHESLIAFSNATYYQGRLSTFPSPDGMESKVRLVFVENGVYDRGFTKRNKEEANALVAEVVRRLSDPSLSSHSIGVVTFSSVQKDYIERLLTKEIVRRKLETAAYDREEPIFVKNLENVQGDERDVILFSVCYGPDRTGKISLNFGPLNQTGGWRRLNVAVSRAREEMVIFASMTSAMIDLSKTTSKGVAGLKGFLEFAGRGKLTMPVGSGEKTQSLGKFIAADLAAYGYECRYDVGASSFKIDVAVIDPKNPDRFILAILGDGRGSVYDAEVLEPQALRLSDWNVTRVYAASYYSNPQKEIRRLRELLDKLTGAGNRRLNVLKMRQSYKVAEFSFPSQSEEFIVNAENDKELLLVMKKVIAKEEPVSEGELVHRVMNAYAVQSSKAEKKLKKLLAESNFKREKLLDDVYFYGNDRAVHPNKYRVTEQGTPIVTPYDVFALMTTVLENRIALQKEELFRILLEEFHLPSHKKNIAFLESCLKEGVARNYFLQSVAGRVMLA